MRGLLGSFCEHIEDPRSSVEPVFVSGHKLPAGYLDLLRIANGFVSSRKTFRLFGIDTKVPALDLRSWNDSPWVAEYGELAANLVFIAENVFGDQYGLRFWDGAERAPVLVKFWCEGGKTEVIDVESFDTWLASSVLCETPTALDWPLAMAAFAQGLAPSVEEHLSFSLPLVVGGENELSNLEVIDRVFHLHLLGQLSQKNRGLPDGARIDRFRS